MEPQVFGWRVHTKRRNDDSKVSSHEARRATPVRDDATLDPMTPATEAIVQMVAGLRRGDRLVMSEFFRTYAAPVRRTLRRLLGPADDLEDLVHDVFVQAIDGIDRLREPALLPAWMRGMAVIQAKRRLQKQYRRRWLGLSSTGELPEVPAAPADLAAREAFRSVHDIMSQMRPEDRIAVVLHRVEGLTIQAAAEAMDLSTSTFKRRLRHGEERLRTLADKSPAIRIWLEGARESQT
jgi:RNA polymerase sigma-70 factor (ECF subfamily)